MLHHDCERISAAHEAVKRGAERVDELHLARAELGMDGSAPRARTSGEAHAPIKVRTLHALLQTLTTERAGANIAARLLDLLRGLLNDLQKMQDQKPAAPAAPPAPTGPQVPRSQ